MKKKENKYILMCAALGMMIGAVIGLIKGLYSTDALKYLIYLPIGLIIGIVVGAIINLVKKKK